MAEQHIYYNAVSQNKINIDLLCCNYFLHGHPKMKELLVQPKIKIKELYRNEYGYFLIIIQTCSNILTNSDDRLLSQLES